MFEPPVQRLIDELARLPGIGRKSAQRLACLERFVHRLQGGKFFLELLYLIAARFLDGDEMVMGAGGFASDTGCWNDDDDD